MLSTKKLAWYINYPTFCFITPFSYRGQIQSPWLGDKVDSVIGLPRVNVFESTLEWI